MTSHEQSQCTKNCHKQHNYGGGFTHLLQQQGFDQSTRSNAWATLRMGWSRDPVKEI
jgi:hypothetical protein